MVSEMTKTVLLTGCSSGIGRAVAEKFAAEGWNVVATARNPAKLDEFLRRYSTVLPRRLDVTDEASIEESVTAAIDRFGSIDVLVNNAGYGLFGPFEGATNGELEAIFRTNFFGAAATIRHVLPHMRRQKSGIIVNISSLGGRIATPFAPGYFASKFALEGFSESLRYEVAPHGIRVKLIEPAHFKTGFLGSRLQFTSHPAYQQSFQTYMKWVRREEEQAPEPTPVVNAVYRAANDSSHKLRYPVGGSTLLFFHRLFPDDFWRRLNAMGMAKEP